MKPSKLILLGIATVALLVLPRRSSRSDAINDISSEAKNQQTPKQTIKKIQNCERPAL